jgi:geranylgeranyl diphosphate synthase type II
MQSIDQIYKQFSAALARQDFSGKPSDLYEPIQYTLSLGGKRLRPVLLLAACDLFDGDLSKATGPAIGIEIFHNFTLLHDDIMDQAPLRRGQPTVYKKWNSNLAILSGDTMFALAYQYMQLAGKEILPRVLQVFNRAAIEVCEGQQFDMGFETANDVGVEEYMEMIRLKTAVLFGASLQIGAIIAGADAQNAGLIYQFGENMGLAFQLQDDLLDLYGNEDKFGKTIGWDIASNKKTFLYIKAFELADSSTFKRLQEPFADPLIAPEKKVNSIQAIYDDLKIKELTRSIMDTYYHQALDNLRNIQVADSRKGVLRALIDQMMVREY